MLLLGQAIRGAFPVWPGLLRIAIVHLALSEIQVLRPVL